MIRKTTILIVDDHKMIRDAWEFVLIHSTQHEIIGNVGDGQTAIDLTKEKKPDVILLDINMNPVNGFEVIKSVRKFSPLTKVIAVTHNTQPTYVRKMFKLGAKGYVSKNSSHKEMLDAINAVIKNEIFICQEIKDILSNKMVTETGDDIEHRINKLSERELEIIKHLKTGLTSKQISSKLFISSKTVEVHRHNIFKKMGVKNTAALISAMNHSGDNE